MLFGSTKTLMHLSTYTSGVEELQIWKSLSPVNIIVTHMYFVQQIMMPNKCYPYESSYSQGCGG